ncbi:MAG: barstar family protein, partial [Pseudomonadota bacterium]
MKTFKIDVSDCMTADDVYQRLLAILDPPDWHGRNLDALWDSITSDINGVLPPYAIEVVGRDGVPKPVSVLLARIQTVFERAQID